MANVFQNLDWSVLTSIFVRIIPALICITFHELAHGFTAYRLGDNTAKDMGRLTFNPIKHIDVFGLLMMVVFRFGWAKPVPVNMRNFKKPKWHMAITAIAGPLSNLILAVVVIFILGLVYIALGGPFTSGFAEIVIDTLFFTAYLSIALAVFNMLPIPPLDGSKVLFSLLPEKAYFKLMRYERYGMVLLILLVNLGFILDSLGVGVKVDIFGATIGKLTETLYGYALYVFDFAMKLVN